MPQLRQEDTLDRAGLDRVQRSKLGHALEIILRSNEFYKRKIGGLGFDATRDPLHSLPLTTRAEIQRDQADSPPYGSLLTFPIEKYNRLSQTSGSGGAPMRWLDTPESWTWWCSCWDTIYQAAGISKSDRLFFPFSFGPFIGFWGAYDAAVAQGLFAIPAGGGLRRIRTPFVETGLRLAAQEKGPPPRTPDFAQAKGTRKSPDLRSLDRLCRTPQPIGRAVWEH